MITVFEVLEDRNRKEDELTPQFGDVLDWVGSGVGGNCWDISYAVGSLEDKRSPSLTIEGVFVPDLGAFAHRVTLRAGRKTRKQEGLPWDDVRYVIRDMLAGLK